MTADPQKVAQVLSLLLHPPMEGSFDELKSKMSAQLEGVTPEDYAEAQRQLPTWMDLELAETDQQIKVFDVLVPHMAVGAKTWDEIFDRLTPDEWQRLAEILGISNDDDVS